jgi:ABC-type transport system involved in multi-copper enzyme maturation permease subunit
MKIRTTDTGWLFLTGFIAFTALALTVNGFSTHYQLYPDQGSGDRAQALAQAAQARTPAGVAAISASMMTSGQRIGVIFALLLGVLIITSEFANQTAAVTFVTVPGRAAVIRAKLAAAACCGALFWLVGTIIAAVATPLFLYSQHVSISLAGWTVVRPVLLSLLAFVAWGVFGLGLGAVLRGQTTSLFAAIAAYSGSFGAILVFTLLYNLFHQGRLRGHDHIRAGIPARPIRVGRRTHPDRLRGGSRRCRSRLDQTA